MILRRLCTSLRKLCAFVLVISVSLIPVIFIPPSGAQEREEDVKADPETISPDTILASDWSARPHTGL